MKNKYIKMFEDNDSGADFSSDGKYRYSLWRIWDKTKPLVMFVGLNPSTANETDSDPTIRSVGRITKANGYGGFYMMNCYAYISTDPDELYINPMNEEQNNNMLTVVASKCSFIDNEPLCHHEKYMGRRKHRGLFISKNKVKINADCNGSGNIIRKVIPNAFANGIQGVVVRPVRVNPYKLNE